MALTTALDQFLDDREREILLARLKADGDAADDEPFSWGGVSTYTTC
jgi:hypothetical protein